MPLAPHRSRTALSLTLAAAIAVLALALAGPATVRAQGEPPPGPVTYSGAITVGGAPAPDGLSVVARIANPVGADYQSQPRQTQGGQYKNLIVGPVSTLFNYRAITFHIIAVEDTPTAHLTEAGLTAAETDTFIPGPGIKDGYNLSFPAIPPAPITPTRVLLIDFSFSVANSKNRIRVPQQLPW